MKRDIAQRRRELLETHQRGGLTQEKVKDLAVKYEVSESAARAKSRSLNWSMKRNRRARSYGLGHFFLTSLKLAVARRRI